MILLLASVVFQILTETRNRRGRRSGIVICHLPPHPGYCKFVAVSVSLTFRGGSIAYVLDYQANFRVVS